MSRGLAAAIAFLALIPWTISGQGIQSSEFLVALEREIVREHNLARTHPARYAAHLAALRPHFNHYLLEVPGSSARMTKEGVRAVDVAIRFLRNVDGVSPVRVSRGMSQGARDHVDDQGPAGETGHAGRDGSQAWDRVNRYGSWKGSIAENVAYGYESAREIVMQLIIDDGVPGRGHRENIFNPDFTVVGVACGPHKRFEVMCVITYADDFEDAN